MYKNRSFDQLHEDYAAKYGHRWLGANQESSGESLSTDWTSITQRRRTSCSCPRSAAELLDTIELEIEFTGEGGPL
jgi:hypothetical protein